VFCLLHLRDAADAIPLPSAKLAHGCVDSLHALFAPLDKKGELFLLKYQYMMRAKILKT
jgi:hypothetical protein